MVAKKTNIAKTFGDRVRSLREERGWPQDELAHRAGMHRTYIGGIERAERNATLQVVERIAVALDVEPSDLLK